MNLDIWIIILIGLLVFLSLVVAGGLAWGVAFAWRHFRELRADVDRLRQYNLGQAEQLAGLEQQARRELAALRLSLLRANGQLKISEETPIGQALRLHPRVGKTLASFGIGGAEDDHFDLEQTISEAAGKRPVDLTLVLDALNRLFDEPTGGTGADGPLRIVG